MTEPTNLNVERARKAGDCRLMTVKDCLEQALADCEEEGWDRAIIVLTKPIGDDGFEIEQRSVGVTTLEARGLMLSNIMDATNGIGE
jgi:hypothetical protein